MKNTLAKCNEEACLPSLHLSTVELRRKLQEKLHRVTWPLISIRSKLFLIEVQYTQSSIGAGVTVGKKLAVRHCTTRIFLRLKEYFILGRERWY